MHQMQPGIHRHALGSANEMASAHAFDWRAHTRDQAEQHSNASSSFMMSRFCYESWEGKVAYGFETNWDWLKDNANKKGKRTSGELEEQLKDVVGEARFFHDSWSWP